MCDMTASLKAPSLFSFLPLAVMVPVPSVCDQKSHAVRLTTICSQQIVVASSNLTQTTGRLTPPLPNRRMEGIRLKTGGPCSMSLPATSWPRNKVRGPIGQVLSPGSSRCPTQCPLSPWSPYQSSGWKWIPAKQPRQFGWSRSASLSGMRKLRDL